MEQNFLTNVVFHLFLFFFLSPAIFTNKMAMAQNTRPISIRVGLVLEINHYVGQMALNCISMALEDFYATYGHYKTRLVLFDRDAKGDIMGAAAAGLDLVKNIQVQAIIGPMSSGQASFLIALGSKAQVPVITFSATSPSLSSFKSPYFIRATLSDSSQVKAIGAIVKAYGWREVVLVYEGSEFGEGIVPFLTDALEEVNARVPYRSVISSLATDDQITAELYKLMTMQTRVFIVHMLLPLGPRLFLKAKQLGMMSEDYVWIITDGIGYELSSLHASVIESMEGVIGVRSYTPITEELEDFAIRYKKRIQQNNPKVHSSDLNIYGLWAYDAAVALAMAAEEARLINPRFQEVNISRNSTDLEAFGVSSVGPSLVRALSTTTFRGLSGNFHLVDGQLQSPPYQIINVVGPEAQGVGYWTEENGIVKDLNFPNTKAYSTSKSNFGSIKWPGDKTSPGKGWVIPTNGKKLRIGVPINDSFAAFVRVTWRSDNSTNVEGHCIDIFEAAMKELPYGVQYEYIPFATPDHMMAGDYNDLTHQVHLGNYDAVVGDVTIVANRSQYVDFTLPFMESGIIMAVPYKDDKRRNAWIFVKPLTWELWLTTFGPFVLVGLLIWILEHRINEDFRGPPWYQAGMTFWFAFSTMVFAHKEKVISNLSRIVLIIWFMIVFVLTQSYTASLTSMLTVQQLNPTVKDVNELVKNKGSYVGYKNGSFVYGFLRENLNIDESRLVPFNSEEQMDELFSKGNGKGGIAAAFHEVPYIKVFLNKYCSKYTTVDPIYKADGFGFVFPKGSPLVPDISRAKLNVTESRISMEIDRKWWGDKDKCQDTSYLLSHEKSLGLASFWVLFAIIGGIGFLALMTYVVRFLHQNWEHISRPVEPQRTIWGKIVKFFNLFDNRDLTSHTFKISTEIIYRDQNLLFQCPLCRFFSRSQEYNEIIQGNSPRNDHTNAQSTTRPPQEIMQEPPQEIMQAPPQEIMQELPQGIMQELPQQIMQEPTRSGTASGDHAELTREPHQEIEQVNQNRNQQ